MQPQMELTGIIKPKERSSMGVAPGQWANLKTRPHTMNPTAMPRKMENALLKVSFLWKKAPAHPAFIMVRTNAIKAKTLPPGQCLTMKRIAQPKIMIEMAV